MVIAYVDLLCALIKLKCACTSKGIAIYRSTSIITDCVAVQYVGRRWIVDVLLSGRKCNGNHCIYICVYTVLDLFSYTYHRLSLITARVGSYIPVYRIGMRYIDG